MNCLKCKSSGTDGITFEVMKVASKKIKSSLARPGRMLTTEQKLCGFENFRICESCIQKKLDSIKNPIKNFAEKFALSFIFLVIGVSLIVTNLNTQNDNAVIAGILCIVVFAFKLSKFVKTSKKKKETFSKFSENNARFVAAWECLSEVAPRRNSNSETVFFIPVTKATFEMNKEDFSSYYRLTNENAEAFYKLLHSRKNMGN